MNDTRPIKIVYTIGSLPKWYEDTLQGDDELLETLLTSMAKTLWGSKAHVEFGYNSAKTMHEIAVYGWSGSIVMNRAIELGYVFEWIKIELRGTINWGKGKEE